MDNISKQIRSGSRSFRRPVALAVAAWAAMAAGQALAATNVDLGTGATVTTTGPADTVVVTATTTQVTGSLTVGTASTTVVPVSTPGAGGGGILPYIVDNGDGTSTVYTITDAGATLSTTTTSTTTGGVTLDPNGNIVAQSGGVTTQVTTNTSDVATAVIIDNVTGLPIPADPRNAVGVLGTYDPLAGVYVADGGTTVVGGPVTVSTGGGNLLVSGNGSFGASVTMNGNQINNLADGAAPTDAATVGQMAAADTVLQGNIDTEAATRAAADTVLQGNINAEATTRAAADVVLQDNITAEAATRSAADTTLQSNINSEASTRAAADTTLQSNINSEAASRILGDHRLDQRIDTADKGIAMAMSMSAIPTVDYGQWALGVGVGHFKGETAAAVGATVKIGERAKFRVNFAAAGGETGGSAGFAVGF